MTTSNDVLPTVYLTLDDLIHYCDAVLQSYGTSITWTDSLLIELFDDCCTKATRHSLQYSSLDLPLNKPTDILDDIIWTLISGCHLILDRLLPPVFRYRVPSVVYNIGDFKFKLIYGRH